MDLANLLFSTQAIMNVLRFSDLCAQGKVSGQRVFIRADLNVPQDEAGRITEDTRIRSSVPCIQMALEAGAAVMVTSHLGRPTEGEFKPEDSLAPIAQRLSQLLGREVPVIGNWVDGVTVQAGQVVMLENCRVNKGEKKNAEGLARQMAALCDIYVNDAFGTAHRAEGTTYGIAQYAPVACAGPLLAAEIDAISQALAQPKRPLAAIVAGSKVSTKLTILQSLGKNVDQLIVGGGIANTFMLAAGLKIGKSLAEPDLLGEANDLRGRGAARLAGAPLLRGDGGRLLEPCGEEGASRFKPGAVPDEVVDMHGGRRSRPGAFVQRRFIHWPMWARRSLRWPV